MCFLVIRKYFESNSKNETLTQTFRKSIIFRCFCSLIFPQMFISSILLNSTFTHTFHFSPLLFCKSGCTLKAFNSYKKNETTFCSRFPFWFWALLYLDKSSFQIDDDWIFFCEFTARRKISTHTRTHKAVCCSFLIYIAYAELHANGSPRDHSLSLY